MTISVIEFIYNVFSCDQASLWIVQSVSLSVGQSVCHTFYHYVSIIVASWHFQELIPLTEVMSMQTVKLRGQRSRSQVKTQFSRFRTITPIWIPMWWWNDAQSLMWHRIGALFFFKVIHQISRLHGTKKSPILTRIGHFWTVTPVWIHWWLWNDAQSLT